MRLDVFVFSMCEYISEYMDIITLTIIRHKQYTIDNMLTKKCSKSYKSIQYNSIQLIDKDVNVRVDM